jgi:hypothetical protein
MMLGKTHLYVILASAAILGLITLLLLGLGLFFFTSVAVLKLLSENAASLIPGAIVV